MARVVPEVYIQVDGKVYVSRDYEGGHGKCKGCVFSGKPWTKGIGSACISSGKQYGFLCTKLEIIWKELKANE